MTKIQYTEYQNRLESIDNVVILHGFIMVLAIGNAIRGYVEPKLENPLSIYLFGKLDNDFIPFVICIIFVIRFFLGDRSYLKNYKPKVEYLFILDMVNVILASILIAYASFLVRHPPYLFQMLTLILIFEVVWLWLRSFLKRISGSAARKTNNIDGEDQAGINVSHIISVFTLIWIAFLLYGQRPLSPEVLDEGSTHFSVAWQSLFSKDCVQSLMYVFAVNSAVDVALRIRSYFGGKDWNLSISAHKATSPRKASR